MTQQKKKIAIVAVSLAKGGLERFCANLSILLSDDGYDVHLIVLNDDIDYEYKGTLFNLGKYKSAQDTFMKRILRFRHLRRYFRQQKFDYIIDNRVGHQALREVYYALYIYGLGAQVIYMQHSSRLESHFPDKSLVTKILVRYASAFVGVSKGVTEKFNKTYQTTKCQTIYNFKNSLERSESELLLPENYFLFLGRLDDATKNIRLLLEAFSLAQLPTDFKLVLLGSGPDKQMLEAESLKLGLADMVVFYPFMSAIYPALVQAWALVLSSRYEGFGMVLVEALSCGTPVISVDCENGPREIVQNEYNGLLVENHNPQALAQAMAQMVNDDDLYQTCRSNAEGSIAHLDKDIIVKQWQALLR